MSWLLISPVLPQALSSNKNKIKDIRKADKMFYYKESDIYSLKQFVILWPPKPKLIWNPDPKAE